MKRCSSRITKIRYVLRVNSRTSLGRCYSKAACFADVYSSSSVGFARSKFAITFTKDEFVNLFENYLLDNVFQFFQKD